jgi:hypothetical protein
MTHRAQLRFLEPRAFGVEQILVPGGVEGSTSAPSQ